MLPLARSPHQPKSQTRQVAELQGQTAHGLERVNPRSSCRATTEGLVVGSDNTSIAYFLSDL